MRFPKAAHMPDDGGEAPVWARRTSGGRGGGGNPLVGLIVTLLTLIGALTIGLAVWQKSFAAGGAKIDGWIAPAVNQVKAWTGKAGDKVEAGTESAAEAAGDAAAAAGDAASDAGDAAEKAGDKAAAQASAPAKK
ncbi:MAG TPA: hypothetical protein VEA15_04925 [Caulobacteraceae bacterium]|nr:hypothetical protein [Caulobacteraceae bacterium]